MSKENKTNELEDILQIDNVSENTQFWLVRTKQGYFYDEYIREDFIALGWNTVLKNVIDNLDDEIKIKRCKEEINKKYGTKQGGTIYNKCTRFVNEIQEGDIIMIPSSSNNAITFATAGKYYEEDDGCTYEKEIEVNKRIEDGEEYGTAIDCPYAKRRKIKILKTVSGDRINPHLYRVLASYHGLSNIDDYGKFILRSIYSLYYWAGNLNIVIKIDQPDDVDTMLMSEFLYNVSTLVKIDYPDAKITGKFNLNSEGDIQVIVNNAMQLLSSGNTVTGLIMLIGGFFGGKYGSKAVKPLLDFIIEYRETSSKLKDDNQKRKLKDVEIEEKKLDYEKKKFDFEQYKEVVKKVSENSTKLKVDPDEFNNVINFNHFLSKKDE